MPLTHDRYRVAEAAQIVLNAPVQKTMIPLNVTHTAIVTKEMHFQILVPGCSLSTDRPSPPAFTALRHTLSTLITFFAETYKSIFGFENGPPLHDALTIAYVVSPNLFDCQRYRVDVECHGAHSSGETIVDIWQYRTCDDTWGSNGRNCLVAKSVDVNFPPKATSPSTCNSCLYQVNAFFDIFLECIARGDAVSPLNSSKV
jgi:uridine nucleosidase